jgi:hypothetical protein
MWSKDMMISGCLLSAAAAMAAQQVIADVGFDGPEAVRYDAEADHYVVSNLGPRGTGNDGFVSLVSPDGSVIELKWIEGGRNGVELYDPLGVLIEGDSIHIADTDAVRRFDRRTGAALDATPAPGAQRLNDLAIAPDGTIYVTDSASENEPGALYRIRPGASEAEVFVERSEDLDRPNGIAVTPDGFVVHGGLESDRLVFRSRDGEIVREARLPTGRIDGIVALADGGLLVASQDGGCVYLVPEIGAPVVVVDGIAVPAAIGFDTRRDRVLIPQIAAATVTLSDLHE